MIVEIQKILSEKKTVSLDDLSLQLGIDTNALEKILEILVKKGRLAQRVADLPKQCRSCCGQNCCGKEVIYEWIR